MRNQPTVLEGYDIKIQNYPVTAEFPIHHFTYSPESVIHDLHYHSFMEIGYCAEGSGIFIIDGQVIPFEAGKVLILFPNQLHKAQSHVAGSTWHFIYIQAEMLLSGISIESQRSISKIFEPGNSYDNLEADSPGIRTAVCAMIEELSNPKAEQLNCIKALFWYLCLQLSREIECCSDAVSNLRNVQRLHRLAPVIEYITKNFASEISVSELAEHCYMSLTTLRREFSESLHMSPLEYIIMTRIKTAAHLIRNSDKSICEISAEVGFVTLSSFNRHFKHIMGCAPRQYRKG